MRGVECPALQPSFCQVRLSLSIIALARPEPRSETTIFSRRTRARLGDECSRRATSEFLGRAQALDHAPPDQRQRSRSQIHGARRADSDSQQRSRRCTWALRLRSYTLDRAQGQPQRPVVFVWNGGPGANSTTVHFVGFGPRRLRSSDDPAHPPATPVPVELYDNEATWLDFADLVFVDPVGTGFARPTKPEYAAEFLNTLGDLASTAEFIRLYLTRFDLLNTPVFLAGESYGTWRASGAAEALEKKGIRVAGVILISGGVQMGKVSPDAVRTALSVAARTATAFHHKKLAPELLRDEKATLDEARKWAMTEYAPAWERRDSLSDAEREKTAAQLARYTGVDPSTIDRKTLMMSSPQFTSTLLRDRNLTLGRYDMRITQPAGGGRGGGGGGATSSEPVTRGSVMMNYIRTDLGFKTDLTYQGVENGYVPAGAGGRGAAAQWVWNQGTTTMSSAEASATRAGAASVGSGDGPPGGSQPWLRRAMDLDPKITVFVAAGLYDSLNSCADNDYLVSVSAAICPQLYRRVLRWRPHDVRHEAGPVCASPRRRRLCAENSGGVREVDPPPAARLSFHGEFLGRESLPYHGGEATSRCRWRHPDPQFTNKEP